jgi:uncharacterized membrane protein YhaH (DUF805 family)
MKTKTYWYVAGLLAALAVIVPLLSAIVTVTGAFNLDPSGRANRMDFVWAAVFSIVAMSCFYRVRQLSRK